MYHVCLPQWGAVCFHRTPPPFHTLFLSLFLSPLSLSSLFPLMRISHLFHSMISGSNRIIMATLPSPLLLLFLHSSCSLTFTPSSPFFHSPSLVLNLGHPLAWRTVSHYHPLHFSPKAREGNKRGKAGERRVRDERKSQSALFVWTHALIGCSFRWCHILPSSHVHAPAASSRV